MFPHLLYLSLRDVVLAVADAHLAFHSHVSVVNYCCCCCYYYYRFPAFVVAIVLYPVPEPGSVHGVGG